MLDITSKTEEEMLTFDVSDEALDRHGHGERQAQLYSWGLHWPVRVPRLIVQLTSERDRREAVFLFHARMSASALADIPSRSV